MATKIDVPMWQARVQRCLDLQSTKTVERQQSIKLLKGEFFGSPFRGLEDEDVSELNFVYEYIKVKNGGVYARDPFIFVRSFSSSKWAPFAETMQTSINYYWRELKCKQKMKKAILDGILIPPGWIGIGYTGRLEKRKQGQEDLFGEELQPVKTKTEAEQGILDETIKSDDVFVKHISSWNIIWPDGYHDPREAPYLIEIQDLPLVDILNNSLFKNSKNDLKGTMAAGKIKKIRPHTMNSNIPISQDQSVDDETQKKRLFHIWDKRSNMRFTIAENFNSDTLFETEWNYLIEGFPKYPLIFNEIPQSDTEANSYPLSDIVPMLPQLRDLSIINSAILRHGKRQGTIMIAKKGSLTEPEIARIQGAEDLELILLETFSADTLKTFSTPSLPGDWYRIRSLILEDLMRISGFQQLLGQAKGIETATESENLRLGETIRRSESVDIVEDFTVDIARGLAGLIWQFVSREKISRIVGEPVTEQMWPTLPENMDEARQIIQQELQFRIDAGSTRPPKDEAVERKQWVDLVFGLKERFPNRLKDGIILAQLLKKFDFKDIDDAVIGFDDQEIAVAQEENKLLLQGVRQLVSPNELHIIHLKVHGQVQQTPGMEVTPEYDEHVLKHAEFMEMQQPRVAGGSQPTATAPEMRRGGVPAGVNLAGAAGKVNRGTGR